MCSAATRCFKEQHPEVEVHFATKEVFKDLAFALSGVDKVKTLGADFSEFANEVKEESYDYVFDLHHNLRTLRLRSGIRAAWNSYPKENLAKWMMVNLKTDYRLRHVSLRYFDSIRSVGVNYDGQGLSFKSDALPHSGLILNPDVPALAVALGAKFGTKKIPVEGFEAILGSLDIPIYLLGGKEDIRIGEALSDKLGDRSLNLAGKCSILESASVLNASSALLCGDTGLMHIAAALKKPVFSVWGNTVPEFGMYPLYPEDQKGLAKIYQVKELSCRPCSKIGFEKCPKRHFKCMREQDWKGISRDLSNYFSGLDA